VTHITFDEVRNRLASATPHRLAITSDMREAAVSVVLAGHDGAYLLLIKRAEHAEDPWSGQMALPGGRRDADDPDLLRTAIRETHEETGVPLTRDAVLGRLDDLGPVSPHLPRLLVRPWVFGLSDRPEVKLSQEATLHIWTPLDTLTNKRTTSTVRIRDRERQVAGFRLGTHFVWGMTERILAGFLERIGLD